MGSINFWMVRLSKTTVFERIMYNFGGDVDLFIGSVLCVVFFFIVFVYFKLVFTLRHTKFCDWIALKKASWIW